MEQSGQFHDEHAARNVGFQLFLLCDVDGLLPDSVHVCPVVTAGTIPVRRLQHSAMKYHVHFLTIALCVKVVSPSQSVNIFWDF